MSWYIRPYATEKGVASHDFAVGHLSREANWPAGYFSGGLTNRSPYPILIIYLIEIR
jgi:hypothetical protein